MTEPEFIALLIALASIVIALGVGPLD